ncbi:pyrimidine 5'-nucleotidase [Stakelama sediminis]|uniref:Putative hydrolase of the HAD superfamily n=1 Tax=Stakelama sediminis TaxID=463200 RepID=A0A840YXG7_9SPHN|nr:pyrimidine 5'-nucleotidase [Stakelama sediminis]MBB5718358.1 putative hydrolase of the HAD superfamily [Stakelama sediminis]
MLDRLSHIRNWIFDLDNTLYPASADLFAQIDRRMTAFVGTLLQVDAAEAFRVQKAYFHEHGTTLAGLIANHGVDPHEFLHYAHDVEMDVLEENAPLAAAIARLPGRKLVFTNGDAAYAARVLDRLGLGDSFEAVHDIHATNYRPKPDPLVYRGFCDAYAVDPEQSLFVEDMARNLKPAKDIGMATVWVDNGSEQAGEEARDFIDFTTHDIRHWLESIQEQH